MDTFQSRFTSFRALSVVAQKKCSVLKVKKKLCESVAAQVIGRSITCKISSGKFFIVNFPVSCACDGRNPGTWLLPAPDHSASIRRTISYLSSTLNRSPDSRWSESQKIWREILKPTNIADGTSALIF